MGQRRNTFKILAVLLAFAMAQAYTQLSFAAPASPTSAAFPPPQLLARLTTKGNLPISVNGISASSGTTIGSDAIIETPGNVDATVDLGPLGTLDIEQDTKIKLEYNGDCVTGSGGASGLPGSALQRCSVKVTVYEGCVTSNYRQGVYFRAVTDQQLLIRDNDRNEPGTIKVCAGGPGGPAGAAGAAGAAAARTGGLSTVAKVAIAALVIGGGAGIAWALLEDDNPSVSAPPLL